MARSSEDFSDFGSTSALDVEIDRDRDREGVPTFVDDEDTVRIVADYEEDEDEFLRIEAALRLRDEHDAN